MSKQSIRNKRTSIRHVEHTNPGMSQTYPDGHSLDEAHVLKQ